MTPENYKRIKEADSVSGEDKEWLQEMAEAFIEAAENYNCYAQLFFSSDDIGVRSLSYANYLFNKSIEDVEEVLNIDTDMAIHIASKLVFAEQMRLTIRKLIPKEGK